MFSSIFSTMSSLLTSAYQVVSSNGQVKCSSGSGTCSITPGKGEKIKYNMLDADTLRCLNASFAREIKERQERLKQEIEAREKRCEEYQRQKRIAGYKQRMAQGLNELSSLKTDMEKARYSGNAHQLQASQHSFQSQYGVVEDMVQTARAKAPAGALFSSEFYAQLRTLGLA